MTDVIKRNRRRERFDARKLRRAIENAARESKISDKRVKEVVDRVSRKIIEIAEKKREIEAEDIRERTLRELDALEPAVSEAWRNFDKNKARR